ncbi:Cubilinlike, partial [Caligus rogercresseyi]
SPSHPNAYPHNKICDYLIAQPVGFNIHVEFIDFDIEDSYLCYYDYLEIRDGDNSNSTSIGTFCGDPSRIPPPIDSTHNYLWLRFATDHSESNRGFKLNYTSQESQCGGILKETHGVISSPKDIEHYPHNMDCKWIIKGHPGSIIRLEWTEFILEEEYECSYDYIQVTDKSTNSSGPRYCGTTDPPVLTSVSNEIMVHFVTDSSFADEGFSLRYSIMNRSRVRRSFKEFGVFYELSLTFDYNLTDRNNNWRSVKW